MALKTIFSQKVAMALQGQGFTIVKIGVNPYDPNRKVFLFEETPELLDAFEHLMKGWKS